MASNISLVSFANDASIENLD